MRHQDWNLQHQGLGLEAIPGVGSTILLIGGLFLLDSPNSLIEQGQFEKGKQVLQRIRGTQQVEEEYGTILAAQEVNNLSHHNINRYNYRFSAWFKKVRAQTLPNRWLYMLLTLMS